MEGRRKKVKRGGGKDARRTGAAESIVRERYSVSQIVVTDTCGCPFIAQHEPKF
jgi:hypothetical protein